MLRLCRSSAFQTHASQNMGGRTCCSRRDGPLGCPSKIRAVRTVASTRRGTTSPAPARTPDPPCFGWPQRAGSTPTAWFPADPYKAIAYPTIIHSGANATVKKSADSVPKIKKRDFPSIKQRDCILGKPPELLIKHLRARFKIAHKPPTRGRNQRLIERLPTFIPDVR